MSNWQDTSDSMVFTPLLTCIQTLTALWHHAGEESNQQSTLFEEWLEEVRGWARLAEWKASLKEKLRYGDNLWLPSVDAQELGVLFGIAALADGLGCTPAQLAKAFMELHLNGLTQSSQAESSSGPLIEIDQTATRKVPMVEINQGEGTQPSLAADRAVDYQPLIEALNDWQAMFELALDEATTYLDHEHFPAEDLSASLSEMCELLRDVLAKSSGLHKSKVEVSYEHS